MKPVLSSTESVRLPYRILEILREGKANAITGMQLAARFGYEDDRKIRFAIEQLIGEDWQVLSTVKPPYGYYLPSSQAEIDECVGKLENRAIKIFDRAKKIKQAKRKVLQLSLGV